MGKQYLIHGFLFVCLIYIAAGAANWGIFSFWVMVPFAIAFLGLLNSLKNARGKTIWMVAVVLICLPLAADHSRNKLLFSGLDKPADFSCGWVGVKLSTGLSSHSYFSLYNRESSILREFQAEERVIDQAGVVCGSQMILDHIHFTYPEFEGWAQPVFRDQQGRNFTTVGYSSFDEALESSAIRVNGLHRGWEMESALSRFLGDVRQSMIFVLPGLFVLFFLLVIAIAVLEQRKESNSAE